MAECTCFVPHLLFFFLYLLMLLHKDVFVNVSFKPVASTDYSSDNQNKTMPGPDQEVIIKKTNKTAFTSFAKLFNDAFTCRLLTECVLL